MDNEKWILEVWSKITNKINFTSEQIGASFPHISINGKYDNNDLDWWTNGFWPGLLWLIYNETKDDRLKSIAQECEEKLDKPLWEYEKLHHDVGFMWELSAVANYRLTGNEKSRTRGLIAASHMASRFNVKGNFIRAWNYEPNVDVSGWAIIDCMMNLPLLYWASEELKDPRYKHIAMAHADTVIREFVRADGSVHHIVCFDAETGECIGHNGGQGYCEGSSWSRGQAWALYGFVLSYIYTKKQEYLDTAKKVAHYFISNIQDDYIPLCDFRAPKEPIIKDSTAGAIAASGLIELSKFVDDFESEMYLKNAIKILKALEEKCVNWSLQEQAILTMGTVAYDRNINVPIIYGDYYFAEAISKLKGNNILFW
jgi:unsaturated chondroitin disaccharide hydrolase